MVGASRRTYAPNVNGKVWTTWLVAAAALLLVSIQTKGVADAPPSTLVSPLTHHLGVAILRMDPGPRSREYRESLAYLREHAPQAVEELSGLVLRERGSFRKWQLTYLLGEFGDETAIALLRIFMDEPTPRAQPSAEGSHETDLRYNEEMMSRMQAVSSTARIAVYRPELRDQVVETLIAVAQRAPALKDTAMFELDKLLGADFQSLRRHFGPEDAPYFKPFMPPPEWQGLLSRRMHKHRRQEQELRELRKPLCRAK